jgi:dihydrolipoamide dehydrogenase
VFFCEERIQTQYDIVIVGGDRGYTAAIRAAQLGMQVAVVERDRLGGVCLNWGCIPTKALLRNAEILSLLQHADEWGFSFENLRIDFPRIIKRSRGVAERISKGVEYLMKKNAVTVISGSARLRSAETLEIVANDGKTTTVNARHIVLATGARPRPLPNVPFDRKRILTSTEAMTLTDCPASMIIVGAGAIGIEFASFYQTLGTRITIVEMMPSILPMEDRELTKLLTSSLKKRGIEILTESRVERAQTDQHGVTVALQSPDGPRTLSADVALIAIGVQGNVENLGLETVGVRVERGHCVVDKQYRTSVPGVYAIGDDRSPLLAHAARGRDPPRRRHRRTSDIWCRLRECPGVHLPFTSAGQRRIDGREGEGRRVRGED